MITGKDRENILRAIEPSKNAANENINEILEILRIELEERKNETDDSKNHFENIYWAALLLFLTENVKYVEILWGLKKFDFDLGCMFDCQYLVGGGIQKTVEYCKENNLKDIADYIESMKKCGDLDEVLIWRKNKIDYFYYNQPNPH